MQALINYAIWVLRGDDPAWKASAFVLREDGLASSKGEAYGLDLSSYCKCGRNRLGVVAQGKRGLHEATAGGAQSCGACACGFLSDAGDAGSAARYFLCRVDGDWRCRFRADRHLLPWRECCADAAHR